MKKLLLFVAAFPLFVSCSDDDNTVGTSFFNLAEGNMWVYRRYHSDAQGQNPTPSNQTDTIRIIGQEVIDGQSYYKLTHSNDIQTDYRRIDGQGHLVSEEGVVWHPGTDAQYTYTMPILSLGSSVYQLQSQYTVEFDDETYNVAPYVGYFTPSEGSSPPEGVGEIRAYQHGIGMVFRRCRYVYSQVYYEDRLEYYELNQD